MPRPFTGVHLHHGPTPGPAQTLRCGLCRQLLRGGGSRNRWAATRAVPCPHGGVKPMVLAGVAIGPAPEPHSPREGALP